MTGNTFLPIFVTNWDAQNPPNNCNSYYDNTSWGTHSKIGYMKLSLGLKKLVGLKLDVTRWVPRFMQSVRMQAAAPSVFQGHSEIISLDRKWRGQRPWVTAYKSMVQDSHFSCFVLWHMSLQCFQKSFPKWTVAMNCCFTLCQFPVKLPWRS